MSPALPHTHDFSTKTASWYCLKVAPPIPIEAGLDRIWVSEKASLYGDWGRALQTIPTAIFVLKSWVGCLKEQWQGRRHFNWVSSINVEAEIATPTTIYSYQQDFYGQTETRLAKYSEYDRCGKKLATAYRRRIEESYLRTKPETVLEVGCGSGRIYERLVQDGMGAALYGG